MKVLVVDDDPDILLALDTTLSAEGYEVVTCDRPDTVAQLVFEQSFAAMIIDLSMPGSSGFDVLKTLRQKGIALPTMILSASDERADRLRGLRAGADDYVVKPFDPEELILRLKRLITSKVPRTGEISSDLETYPSWDLLQMLERSRHNGWLSIETAEGTFLAELSQGRVQNASFGRLEGEEALIALFSSNKGKFRFIRGQDQPDGVVRPVPTSVQDLLLRAAWLNDELARVASFLPASQDGLVLAPRAAHGLPEEGHEGLPFAEVLGLVQKDPGMSLETLRQHVEAAPRRLDLTVAKLVAQGLLRHATSASTPEPGLSEHTDLAVQLLLGKARAADRFRDAFTLLLLAQTAAWPKLERLLDALPDTYAGGEWRRLKQKLARTQGGTCTLREADGALNLHVQILNSSTYKKAEKILPLCHAVVVWIGTDGLGPLEQLIQKAEDSPRTIHGWLISDSSVEIAGLAERPQWSVQSPPADLARLLEMLR